MSKVIATLVLSLAAACAAGESPELEPSRQQEAVIVEVCASGDTTFGIDVSRYQGDIDWGLVAGANVEFAYIQISRAIDDIDPKFEINWAGAKAAAIARGAYQRFQPDEDAIAQADIFLDKLGAFSPGDLPPMLDVEDDGGLSASEIEVAVRQWLVYVETATGVRPIIYTGRYFWEGSLNSADLSDYPLWIAHYTQGCPTIPSPWTEWAIHQYSSSAVLPGITANTVDVNHFNGSLDDLLALACGADCPPCQRIEKQGGIVDESSECYSAFGSPGSWRHESDGYGGGLVWTYTTDLAEADNFGQWDLFLDEGGRYLLEAYTASPWSGSQSASYQLRHLGQESVSELDQSAKDGWAPLGEFEFAAGGEQWLRLGDNSGEALSTQTKIVFDAVRLSRLDLLPDPDPEPIPDPVPDPDPEMRSPGGCGIASGGACWPILLLLLALVARRRSDFGIVEA